MLLKLSWLYEAWGVIIIDAFSAQLSNTFRNQVDIEVLLSYFAQFFLHFVSLDFGILLIALALFKRFEVALSRFSFLASLRRLLKHL